MWGKTQSVFSYPSKWMWVSLVRGLVIYTLPGGHINLFQQRNRIWHSSYKRGYYLLAFAGVPVLLQSLPGFHRGQTDGLSGNTTATTFSHPLELSEWHWLLPFSCPHPSSGIQYCFLFTAFAGARETVSKVYTRITHPLDAKQPMHFANF